MEEIKFDKQKSDSQENSSLKRIGSLIKEARLSRNQSIEELAANLKIGEHQLKAIEDGNEEKLPEEVFVKAMVRRIADKLKLDKEFVINELKPINKEVKIAEINSEFSNKNDNKSTDKKLNPFSFAILIAISGIFGLLASSLIFNLFSESLQDKTTELELIKKN